MEIHLDIIQISQVIRDPLDYENNVFVMRAANVLDMGESDKMWTLLKTLAEGGARYMIVDMEGLEFIDSAGIGVLINAAKVLRMNRGDITLMRVSPRIESIFSPIKLQRFIKIFSSVDACLRHFKLG
ncbi:MAG: STAS domain-containing protein [Spirochaetes bacterium]|nr:STAS domain-containing protein [Spirochaetota bacterium]